MRTNEEIVSAFQAGEQDALADLWRQNERGVQYVADRLAAAGLGEAEDLKQEGFFGLKRAAELYDPAEGAPFMSYAWHWIRQAMFASIRKTGQTVRLPAYLQELLAKYRRFVDDYRKECGEDPEDARIRYALGIEQKALEQIRAAALKCAPASLDGPAGDPEDGLTLADSVPTPGDFAEDVCRTVDHEHMVLELDRILEKMTPRRRDAVKARFFENKTLDTFENTCAREGIRELRKYGQGGVLERYYIDYLSGAAYKGGLSYFKRTGSSVTEAQAIRHVELKERREKTLQKLRAENAAELLAIQKTAEALRASIEKKKKGEKQY